jgi:hypothetical protein
MLTLLSAMFAMATPVLYSAVPAGTGDIVYRVATPWLLWLLLELAALGCLMLAARMGLYCGLVDPCRLHCADRVISVASHGSSLFDFCGNAFASSICCFTLAIHQSGAVVSRIVAGPSPCQRCRANVARSPLQTLGILLWLRLDVGYTAEHHGYECGRRHRRGHQTFGSQYVYLPLRSATGAPRPVHTRLRVRRSGMPGRLYDSGGCNNLRRGVLRSSRRHVLPRRRYVSVDVTPRS